MLITPSHLNPVPSVGLIVWFDDHPDQTVGSHLAHRNIAQTLVIVVVLVRFGHPIVLGYCWDERERTKNVNPFKCS